MSVAETSRGGFIAVPHEVACNPDLGDGAFRTYCVLRHYCFGRRSYCWPSIRTLARDRACSEETIRRHLRELSAASLVRVDKRGRGNVYHFPDEHMFWPTAEAQRQEPVSVKKPLSESAGSTPHGFVGQGFKREEIHTSPPHDGDTSFREPPTNPTAAQLISHGVSPGTAAKLATSYGEHLCFEAVRSLIAYQQGGLVIRNPGGWLYRAITQGFARPPDLPENTNTPAPAIDAEKEAQTHLEHLKRHRRRALEAQGIADYVVDLWQRVTSRLRESGKWAPVLAAACLRQVDDTNYAIQCRAPRLNPSLATLLPVIREVMRDEASRATTVTLLKAEETW